jgi:hypothetical protein
LKHLLQSPKCRQSIGHDYNTVLVWFSQLVRARVSKTHGGRHVFHPLKPLSAHPLCVRFLYVFYWGFTVSDGCTAPGTRAAPGGGRRRDSSTSH